MSGFIEGIDRVPTTLFPDFPERLEDWICEDHLFRVVGLFVAELNLATLDFNRHAPVRTGRPGSHPAVLLKLFLYGYLNCIPSGRWLEREAGWNVELLWLTGQLVLTGRPLQTSGAIIVLVATVWLGRVDKVTV